MSRQQLEPYRPSNGTEGDCFEAAFCERCQHDAAWRTWMDIQYNNPRLARMMEQAGTVPEGCEILSNALCFYTDEPGFPRDTWVYFNGKPTCLAFRELGGDDDPTAPPRPVDPAQVDLFEGAEIPVGLLLPVLT